MIERQEKDDRIVYGANCAWWGGIENIGRIDTFIQGRAASLPCCPVCRGMLFEIPDAKTWWASVDKYARENSDPGYRGFVEWLRLKHFKNFDEAREVYNAGADKRPGRVKIKGLRP
jgi:hypothetical protein